MQDISRSTEWRHQKPYVIFKIENTINDKIFIGSTQYLKGRWSQYVCYANQNHPSPLSQFIRQVGSDNCRIVKIREIIGGTKDDAKREEQIEINNTPPERLLNIRRSYISSEEKAQENRINSKKTYHKHIATKREYYQKNKARLLALQNAKYKEKVLGKSNDDKKVYSKYNPKPLPNGFGFNVTFKN